VTSSVATAASPRGAFAELAWRPLAAGDLAYVAALEAQIHASPWTVGNFRDAIAAGYWASVGEREGRILAYGVLMLAPGAARTLAAACAAGPPSAVIVGPEGGFTDDELALAQRCGVERVGLGPRVLRAETAAVAALAIVGAFGAGLPEA
jgi:hypothetical protein